MAVTTLRGMTALAGAPTGGDRATPWTGEALPAAAARQQVAAAMGGSEPTSPAPGRGGARSGPPCSPQPEVALRGHAARPAIAATALDGSLRAGGPIAAPATVHLPPGERMGRRSRLMAEIPATGGSGASGAAVLLE